jgi:hypothetical protein
VVVQSAWNPVDTGEQFTLSPTMHPLEAVRGKLLVFGNHGRVKVAGTDGHAQASTCWLSTAAPDELSADGYPLKRSLDQVIADHAVIHTPFRSLELSCNPFEDNRESVYFDNISWYGGSHVARSLRDPKKVFERLFRLEEQASRRSVLDLVAGDARSLRPRLGQRDREKLEEYSHSVRTVEQQIERTMNPPAPEWTALTAPDMKRPPAGIPLNKDEHMRLMLDVMVLALQTDTTRVATFMSAHGFSRQNFTFLDGVKNDHHGMSHHKNQEALVKEYTTVSRWYAQQVQYLLTKMRGIDEGNGSLLDNSIVLYGSEMKDGNGHIKEDLPLVLIGKGQGRVKTGQHLALDKGTPLANLHLTIAQQFGAEIPSFNNVSTGTLNGLFV